MHQDRQVQTFQKMEVIAKEQLAKIKYNQNLFERDIMMVQNISFIMSIAILKYYKKLDILIIVEGRGRGCGSQKIAEQERSQRHTFGEYRNVFDIEK